MSRIIFIICVLFCFELLADYRVYQLQILKSGQPIRQEVSTLDHYQYPEYYPLRQDEEISYITSWMCKGRQPAEAFNPPCPNPGETSKTPEIKVTESQP